MFKKVTGILIAIFFTMAYCEAITPSINENQNIDILKKKVPGFDVTLAEIAKNDLGSNPEIVNGIHRIVNGKYDNDLELVNIIMDTTLALFHTSNAFQQILGQAESIKSIIDLIKNGIERTKFQVANYYIQGNQPKGFNGKCVPLRMKNILSHGNEVMKESFTITDKGKYLNNFLATNFLQPDNQFHKYSWATLWSLQGYYENDAGKAGWHNIGNVSMFRGRGLDYYKKTDHHISDNYLPFQNRRIYTVNDAEIKDIWDIFECKDYQYEVNWSNVSDEWDMSFVTSVVSKSQLGVAVAEHRNEDIFTHNASFSVTGPYLTVEREYGLFTNLRDNKTKVRFIADVYFTPEKIRIRTQEKGWEAGNIWKVIDNPPSAFQRGGIYSLETKADNNVVEISQGRTRTVFYDERVPTNAAIRLRKDGAVVACFYVLKGATVWLADIKVHQRESEAATSFKPNREPYTLRDFAVYSEKYEEHGFSPREWYEVELKLKKPSGHVLYIPEVNNRQIRGYVHNEWGEFFPTADPDIQRIKFRAKRDCDVYTWEERGVSPFVSTSFPDNTGGYIQLKNIYLSGPPKFLKHRNYTITVSCKQHTEVVDNFNKNFEFIVNLGDFGESIDSVPAVHLHRGGHL